MTNSLAPTAAPPIIGKAARDAAGPISRMLATAFHDDPTCRWFLPEGSDYAERVERFFRVTVLEGATLPHDEVYATAGLTGAALWLPPGHAQPPVSEQIRGLPELVRICGRRTVRSLRALVAMDRHHPTEPHWYLWFVGVAAEHRGAGVGAALLQPVLDRCDADGMPAYLDATTPRSIGLYERLGFSVTGELRLPGGGPSMWSMWREPA